MACRDVAGRHASVRRFKKEDVDERDLNAILEAARRAPTSWNLQPLTVIVVRRPDLKSAIAEAIGGQEHVAKAPVLLVFSIDYSKVVAAAEGSGVKVAGIGLASLIEASIDVGLAAGWAGLVAEELGYGIVYVAVYSNPCRVAEILHLPKLTLPLVGLCIGRPAERVAPRPRQPMEVFASHDGYLQLPRGDVARLVAQPFGQKASRLYSHVLGAGGYHALVNEEMVRCARSRGFNV